MNLSRILTAMALLLAAVVVAPPARAQSGHAGIDNYLVAGEAFDRLAANGVPRATDRAAAPVLRRLADWEATFGTESFTIADIPALQQVMRRTLSLISYYFLRDIPEGASPAVSRPLKDRNSTEYQAEIVPISAFMIDLLGATSRVFEDGLANIDPAAINAEGRRGLLEARDGAGDLMTSALDLSIYQGIRPSSGLILARALARNGAIVGTIITPAQRLAVLTRARAVRTALPGARVELDQLIAAMAISTCTGLCAL